MKVGLCGFTMAQSRYAAHFPVVEVQQTFYEPPTAKLMDRWRTILPAPFEFTLKAWQLITHLAKSPTYRRLKRVLTVTERAESGAFRDTAIVEEAWRVTQACQARLGATAILFQCPASFTPTPENLANLRGFCRRHERTAGVRWLFEPRGPAWTNAVARPLCAELDLVHVVDPFVTPPPVGERPTYTYWRLHGITGARHVYSDAELATLSALVPRTGETYVMFNNIPRVVDALRFLDRVGPAVG